ncbi:hypothetical protein Taro_005328 [Colocasia esculenta]|uniref:Uncharacterized protein n=1 Tax=Colocasia esculenta TaxID=4460 RepID=A0A843TSN4_COLES|nr:hypothetical protein [Colocasia esculenta]
MKNWSSSVDTGSGGVDTRDSSQNTFRPIWDSSVDTKSGSVDTRDLPRTPSELCWDSVSTLAQVVLTLKPFQNKTYRLGRVSLRWEVQAVFDFPGSRRALAKEKHPQEHHRLG